MLKPDPRGYSFKSGNAWSYKNVKLEGLSRSPIRGESAGFGKVIFPKASRLLRVEGSQPLHYICRV